MSRTQRKIGEHTFEYAEYVVTVKALWEQWDDRTPEYVVATQAERKTETDENDSFYKKVSRPVERVERPNFVKRLFGAETRTVKTDMEDVVELACERIRKNIDSMYEDIGKAGETAEETFEARMEAESAVMSWADESI